MAIVTLECKFLFSTFDTLKDVNVLVLQYLTKALWHDNITNIDE